MRTLVPFRYNALIPVILLIVAFTDRTIPSHAYGASATPTAAATETVAQPLQFQSIQMFSEISGWAMNGAGPNQQGALGDVFHTQDGGQTWADVTPASLFDHSANNLVGTFFLDNNHAWMATGPMRQNFTETYPAAIWRTSDGGHSWQKASKTLDTVDFNAASFIDATHGWLLLATAAYENGAPAALYQTTDGGITWQLIADDSPHPNDAVRPISASLASGGGFYTGMVFTSVRSGWITASGAATLLHTTDAGKTWNAVDGPPNSALAEAMHTCDLSGAQVYAPNLVSFLAYCAYGDYVRHPQAFWYRSTDDGKTWQRSQLPANVIVVDSSVPQLFMLNSTTGWLIGDDANTGPDCCGNPFDNPTLYQTVTAGKTWTKIAPLPDALRPLLGEDVDVIARNFDFVDDHTGWVIDKSGALLVTNDAGRTWTALNPAITQ